MDKTIREKIRRIKIKTKRVMQSSLVGDYLSAFKGTGLEFDQIREYIPGDDVRHIDWNASAKADKMMVKEFIEERDRTVILLIDTSSSLHVSSHKELKQELVAHVAASLSFIAGENKDKVGALFFSDDVEKWIAPSRGKSHLTSILQTIFTIKPRSRHTNIRRALEFLIGLKKRNAIVFCISDWVDAIDRYAPLLTVARCGYDFVGVRILDDAERIVPDVGLLPLRDPETGQRIVIDTRGGSADNKDSLNFLLRKRLVQQNHLFKRCKIDLLDLRVGEAFINPMVRFFHERTRRQIS